MKKINLSAFAGSSDSEYTCQFDWGDVFVQAGEKGVVVKKEGSYGTAFFEAFPLDTYLRGEGETVSCAEQKAWEKYQKILSCKQHDLTRINDAGRAKCEKCNYTGDLLDNIKKCSKCKKIGVLFSDPFSNENMCFTHFYKTINVGDKAVLNRIKKHQEKNKDSVLSIFSASEKEKTQDVISERNVYICLVKKGLITKEMSDVDVGNVVDGCLGKNFKFLDYVVSLISNALLDFYKKLSANKSDKESSVSDIFRDMEFKRAMSYLIHEDMETLDLVIDLITHDRFSEILKSKENETAVKMLANMVNDNRAAFTNKITVAAKAVLEI